MSIKTFFSIKDLENLSGVKAHTIRIWEKRYGILEPERSDTNIRSYSQKNLKKLLNVALLNQKGVKISKVSAMTDEEIFRNVRELALKNTDPRQSINSFKLSMLNFDEKLFHDTYNQLLAIHSFREIFLNIFLTFIEEIGILWMSNVITPAHEHFISTLIKQKLLVNIERAQNNPAESEHTFVLFLPINELHELGLLYVHLELLLKGYKSVYLGPSVPVESLVDVQKVFKKSVFVSYFTVEPSKENLQSYLDLIQAKVLNENDDSLHLLGRNIADLPRGKQKTNSITVYDDIVSLINEL